MSTGASKRILGRSTEKNQISSVGLEWGQQDILTSYVYFADKDTF